MLESVPEMLGGDARPRICGCVHEDVVVAHVVREAVKDDGLIGYLVERGLDLETVHRWIIPHPGPPGERLPSNRTHPVHLPE